MKIQTKYEQNWFLKILRNCIKWLCNHGHLFINIYKFYKIYEVGFISPASPGLTMSIHLQNLNLNIFQAYGRTRQLAQKFCLDEEDN